MRGAFLSTPHTIHKIDKAIYSMYWRPETTRVIFVVLLFVT